MANRALFDGAALQAVDDKGRVAIPADFRTAIERNAEERLIVIGKHPFDPCLRGYDTGYTQLLHDQILKDEADARAAGREVDHGVRRRTFGRSDKSPFDASGRFVLPPYFRQLSRIGKWAFFLGSAETFEIWAPEVLMTVENMDPELRDLCAYHCSVKGVAL